MLVRACTQTSQATTRCAELRTAYKVRTREESCDVDYFKPFAHRGGGAVELVVVPRGRRHDEIALAYSRVKVLVPAQANAARRQQQKRHGVLKASCPLTQKGAISPNTEALLPILSIAQQD